MSLESKKRRRIARAAARARGELKQAIGGVSFFVAKPRKYIPSWLNTQGGYCWTPRLKRHGGMMMIEAHRERQFEQIDALAIALRQAGEAGDRESLKKLDLLKTWYTWMTENKRRLMSPDVEEFFWPSTAEPSEIDKALDALQKADLL